MGWIKAVVIHTRDIDWVVQRELGTVRGFTKKVFNQQTQGWMVG